MNEVKLEEIIKIAKRDNNTKRNFLLVNSLQGKHIPTSPKQALDLFWKLNRENIGILREESILIIGFSETATAIATSFAINLLKEVKQVYLLLTTREKDVVGNYLIFSIYELFISPPPNELLIHLYFLHYIKHSIDYLNHCYSSF